MQTLHFFTGADGDGASPEAGLIQAQDGSLYGTTLGGGGSSSTGTVYQLIPSTPGQPARVEVLHSFSGMNGDGSGPESSLLQARDGSLYGTTMFGGTDDSGTVYQLIPGTPGQPAQVQVLHSFTGVNGDGAKPMAALIQARDGSLYGTTMFGGTNGTGTVYQLISGTPGQPARVQVLHSFSAFARSTNDDGAGPRTLIQAGDGSLYGTASYGGASDSGTIYQLIPTTPGQPARVQVLYSFRDANDDGDGPTALIQAQGGSFYGTANEGTAANNGTVWQFTPATPDQPAQVQGLHSFSGTNGDGGEPEGNLLQAQDGLFYGTTAGGGANGSGTIYQLVPSIEDQPARVQVLYSFSTPSAPSATNTRGGINGDGATPLAGLFQAQDGSLYGTTSYGGASGFGTVYQLTGVPPIFGPSPTPTPPVADVHGRDLGQFFVLRRDGGDPNVPLTIHFSVGGTARPGVDYVPFGTKRTLKPGVRRKRIYLQNLHVYDGVTRTIVLTIEPDPGYVIGPAPARTVNLDVP